MNLPKRAPYIPRPGTLCRGLEARTTPRGVRVLTIRHTADPVKAAPGWLEKEAHSRMYLDPSDFRREFGLDWTSGKGAVVYPMARELFEAGRLSMKVPGLIRDTLGTVTVYRGWDFGLRRPSCVWAQYDETIGRLVVLRELMPEGINTYEHRDLVAVLSGQLDPKDALEKARLWWQIIEDAAKRGGPPPPWFGHNQGRPIRFVDFAGHEALMHSALVETASAEVTHAQILSERGIYLTAWRSSRKSREDIIRKLLMTKIDGFPGFILDESCPILLAGLMSGIVYPKETTLRPYPQESRKDGYYEHLHDALGYIVVNVAPVTELLGRALSAEYPDPEEVGDTRTPRPPRLHSGEELLGFSEGLDREDWTDDSARDRYRWR